MKALISSLILCPIFLLGFSAHAMPNPASVKCVEMKGQLKLVSSAHGEMGLCKVGGALIEEWTFFRALNGEKQEAVEAYKKNIRETSVHAANPAFGYCKKVGGTIVNVKEANVGEIGLCKFSDGSQIDEWTLFRGPSDSDHVEFNKALGLATSGS